MCQHALAWLLCWLLFIKTSVGNHCNASISNIVFFYDFVAFKPCVHVAMWVQCYLYFQKWMWTLFVSFIFMKDCVSCTQEILDNYLSRSVQKQVDYSDFFMFRYFPIGIKHGSLFSSFCFMSWHGFVWP